MGPSGWRALAAGLSLARLDWFPDRGPIVSSGSPPGPRDLEPLVLGRLAPGAVRAVDAEARRRHPRLTSAAPVELWVRPRCAPGGTLRLAGAHGPELASDELVALAELVARALGARAPDPTDGARRAMLHDLRNELTFASLELERARAEGTEQSAGLRAALAHARALCATLLDGSGEPAAAVGARVNVRALVEEESRAARRIARGSPRASVRIAVDEGLAVFEERARLGRALRNLLANALEASSGGGEVAIGARAVGAQVVIAVEDRGRGMDPARVAELFRGGVSGGGGTGWGTASVLDCARRLGLALSVETGPGEGTRVELAARAAPPEGRCASVLVDPDPERGALRAAQRSRAVRPIWWARSVPEALALVRGGEPLGCVYVARGSAGTGWEELRGACARRDLALVVLRADEECG